MNPYYQQLAASLPGYTIIRARANYSYPFARRREEVNFELKETDVSRSLPPINNIFSLHSLSGKVNPAHTNKTEMQG